MAANNKVIYGNDTIMDISDSTTSANNLLNGAIGYSGTGDRVVGSLIPATPDDLDKAELSIWNLVRTPYTSEGGQLSTGITATINSDGSVTFNGTSSGDTIFWFKGDGDPIYLPKRTSDYLFKCCPDGGSMNTYYANVLVYSGGSFVPIATNTNHQGIHVSTRNGDREVYVNAVIKDGTTVSDLTFNAPSILPIVPADGHVILNDSEAGLQQRRNLKFKGVYTKDTNSVDDITEVDIVRTMTKAQIEALTGEGAKGFLIASDEEGDLPFTTDLVEYRNGESSTDALDFVMPLSKNINFSFAVNNAQNITFTLNDTPSSSYNGSLILFNANRGTMAMIAIGQTQTITVIFGNVTYTISSSGKSITVVPSERMWGKTVILGHVSA